MRLLLFALLFIVSALCADEQLLAKRVYNHLLIEDFISAEEEATHALEVYPNSRELQEALVQVYAKRGDEKKMVAAWERYQSLDPEAPFNRDLVEAMAGRHSEGD